MRTTISISPYNTKRIKKFIDSQKHLLGPRISFSVFVEESLNIAWSKITKKYMDQCYNMEEKEVKRK
jgi:hypothetical protein